MAANLDPMLTIADLDAMPDDGNRYELIEGELYVSRAPSLKHQIISGNFLHKISSYLDNNRIGIIVATPGVIFSQFSGVIPDLIYISNERRQEIATGERVQGAPDLIIEILSPGNENERRDRKIKRQLYGKHQVKEYWVVDPEQETIEVYRLADSSILSLDTTLGKNDAITTELLPGFQCRLADIFNF